VRGEPTPSAHPLPQRPISIALRLPWPPEVLEGTRRTAILRHSAPLDTLPSQNTYALSPLTKCPAHQTTNCSEQKASPLRNAKAIHTRLPGPSHQVPTLNCLTQRRLLHQLSPGSQPNPAPILSRTRPPLTAHKRTKSDRVSASRQATFFAFRTPRISDSRRVFILHLQQPSPQSSQ